MAAESTAVHYRVDELAAASGCSVDTIRYYQRLGLLAPPQRHGRTAIYGGEHAERLAAIAGLADRGFTLAQMGELFAEGQSDPLLANLAARAAVDPSLDRAALAERSGLDAAMVDLVVDAGLVPRSESADGDERFGPEVVDMLRAAGAVLAAGLPFDQLAPLVSRHADHVEQLVDAAIELVAEAYDDDRDGLSATAEDLIPAVTALVAAHFERTLVERTRQRLLGSTAVSGPSA
ncbi:MAG: MerR family transcriptional regulator [Acidimicrobiales bacterium]|nr:MerR family transcriptional regulator [Acidimicrobiales bacterium]